MRNTFVIWRSASFKLSLRSRPEEKKKTRQIFQRRRRKNEDDDEFYQRKKKSVVKDKKGVWRARVRFIILWNLVTRTDGG